MLQLNQRTVIANGQTGLANKQRRRLLIALAVLLVALAAVLIRDQEFWFGSNEAVESTPAQGLPAANSAAVPTQTLPTPTTPALTTQNQPAPKTSTALAVKEHQAAAKPASPAVAAKRSVLPPLQVEVVARDTHRPARSGNNSKSNVAKLEIANDSKLIQAIQTSVPTVPTNAAEHESLSGEGVPELHQTVDTTYPLLGPRMKVQGSVVMQAVIGSDGNIENLRVVSGPAILTAAAQQAVRQWRFKPYLQNGTPVETKATITVNFSIQISDNPAKTS
jgi:TonB family protein